MKKFFILLMLLFLNISFGQSNATTYYFIRHAEKADNSQNPDLSEKGLKRAEKWNVIFSAIGLDAIYSTDYKRTLQTASPTASAKKIDIKLYDPKIITADFFKKEMQGKKILIVGHSNTTPNFVNEIISQKIYEAIEDTTFGNLYIVTKLNETIVFQLLKLE